MSETSNTPPVSRSSGAAARLRHARQEVARRWESRVRLEVPAAREQDSTGLIDSLFDVLDLLERQLESVELAIPLDLTQAQIASEHGEHRARLADYPLPDLMLEYHILQEVLFEELEAGTPLTRWERDTILNVIHISGRVSATRYVAEHAAQRTRAEQERAELLDRERQANAERQALLERLREAHARAQTDARRLADLQRITEAALARTTSLDALLQSCLQYVQQSFECDAVVILLLSDDGEHLEIRAGLGLDRTDLPPGPFPRDQGTAGQILTSGRPLLIPDLWELDASSARLEAGAVRSLAGVPLHLPDPIGVICIGRFDPRPFEPEDVTLLQLIADRLATAIDNASLYAQARSSLARLEEERRLREQFVAALSHDLRTPLSTALMGAQMIQRNPGDPALVGKLAARVAGNISRAGMMINDLLDANRIGAGQKLPLQLEPCDLVTVVRQVLEGLTTVHGDRFELRAPPALDGVWDGRALQRLLENLLTNALKYGDPAASITVILEPMGDSVRLGVHNWGRVLEPAEQARIFHAFHRSRAAATSGQEGWGIGLVLVKGVAEAHGGEVAVESSIERGTLFSARLPRDARPFQEG